MTGVQRILAAAVGVFLVGFIAAITIPGWGLYIMAGANLVLIGVLIFGVAFLVAKRQRRRT